MNTNLGFCLALHRAHASLQLKLDDELGLHHGISFNDFALLNAARETADSIRTEAVESIAPATVEMVSAALATLARTPNLAR
jgi:MarR family transcriptional regulator, organic hydroperoxide resistance regulator